MKASSSLEATPAEQPDIVTSAIKKPRLVRFHYFRGANVHFHSSVLRVTIDTTLLGKSLGERNPSKLLEEYAFAWGGASELLSAIERADVHDNGPRSPLEKLVFNAILLSEAYARSMLYGDSMIAFAAADRTAREGTLCFVWETDTQRISRRGAATAAQFVAERILTSPALHDGAPSFAARRQEFEALLRMQKVSEQTAVLRNAARQRRIPYEILPPRRLRIGDGVYQQRFLGSRPGSVPLAASKLALDRFALRRRLEELGLPTSRFAKAATPSDVVTAVEKIGRKVLLRRIRSDDPTAFQSSGLGSSGITEAFERLAGDGKAIFVEELLPGQEYRMLVVGGKLIAAAICHPPTVYGDGGHTVLELVERLNRQAERGGTRCVHLEVDARMERCLAHQHLQFDSIPTNGTVVRLAASAAPSDARWAIDVTDQVHFDNRDAAERAAKAVGLPVAGVDFICPDIAASYRETGGGIVRVSAAPELGLHCWPGDGRGRDVGGAILDMLAPATDALRVPVGLVVGDRGANTVARSLGQILTSEGEVVGQCLKSGAFVPGRNLKLPPERLDRAPRLFSRDSSITAVVAATSPIQMLKAGTGFEVIDAALFLPPVAGASNSARLEALRMMAGMTSAMLVVDSNDTDALSLLEEFAPTRLIRIAIPEADRGPALDRVGMSGVTVGLDHRQDETRLVLSAGGREVVHRPLAGLPEKTRSASIQTLLRVFALISALKPDLQKLLCNTGDHA